MKIIKLDLPIYAPGAPELLSKMGVIVEDQTTIKCSDNRYIYCKENKVQEQYGGHTNEAIEYEFYCYDDSNPLVTIAILKGPGSFSQRVTVAIQPTVDAALDRMARREEIEAEDAKYLSFEDRRVMILEGNYACLLNIPFSKLRFDEQALLREHGFQCEGSEQYQLLSNHGKRIIAFIKKASKEMNSSSSLPGRFAIGAQGFQQMPHELASQNWNSFLHGTHELSLGLSERSNKCLR